MASAALAARSHPSSLGFDVNAHGRCVKLLLHTTLFSASHCYEQIVGIAFERSTRGYILFALFSKCCRVVNEVVFDLEQKARKAKLH